MYLRQDGRLPSSQTRMHQQHKANQTTTTRHDSASQTGNRPAPVNQLAPRRCRRDTIASIEASGKIKQWRRSEGSGAYQRSRIV